MAITKAIDSINIKAEFDSPRRIIPDVVVHQRGCDCRNVLVVEMKVNDTFDQCVMLDWAKLLAFTDHNSRDGHPVYEFGLFISLSRSAFRLWLFDKDNRGTEITGD